jgi:uncharacterized Zn-binding protein involved in type VI secretion
MAVLLGIGVPEDVITSGAANVLICGLKAARAGDTCAHGGEIIEGSSTVLIGG